MTWQLYPFPLKYKAGAENLQAWLCSAGVFLCNSQCDTVAHCQIRHNTFEHLKVFHGTRAFLLFGCFSGYPGSGLSVLSLSPGFMSNNCLLFCWCFILDSLLLNQPHGIKEGLSLKGLVFWNHYGVLLQWRRQIRAIELNAEFLLRFRKEISFLDMSWICTVRQQVRDGFWITTCTGERHSGETNETKKL